MKTLFIFLAAQFLINGSAAQAFEMKNTCYLMHGNMPATDPIVCFKNIEKAANGESAAVLAVFNSPSARFKCVHSVSLDWSTNDFTFKSHQGWEVTLHGLVGRSSPSAGNLNIGGSAIRYNVVELKPSMSAQFQTEAQHHACF